MLDAFGVEITPEEIIRWNTLALGPQGFSTWNVAISQDDYDDDPPSNDALLANLFPLRNEMRGATVLEVGCGIGRRANHPLRFGVAHYFGIDVASISIAIALYRYRLNPNVTFLHSVHDAADVRALQVDIAYMIDVAYHLEPSRLAAVLRTVAGLLRPGGVVHFDIIRTSPTMRVTVSTDLPDGNWPCYRHSTENIARMGDDNGMTIDRTYEWDIPDIQEPDNRRLTVVMRRVGDADD